MVDVDIDNSYIVSVWTSYDAFKQWQYNFSFRNEAIRLV